MNPETEVKLTALVAGCTSCGLMVHLSREVKELDAADGLIRKVIDCRGAVSLTESTHQSLEIDVRVRIGEGARACLNLSSAAFEKMASISASLNFDPELTGDGGADELELEESAPSTRPELVVVLVGESPVSGEEVILSRVERQQYRAGDIQGGVHEALQRGLERVRVRRRCGRWRWEYAYRVSAGCGRVSIFLVT